MSEVQADNKSDSGEEFQDCEEGGEEGPIAVPPAAGEDIEKQQE